ncbi:MAG: oligosaccharide flippase family protein [Verrucomicrobia bacterium]|nr:oligosaccharide flippase family protein [Verrucomicrobiota bacterium]
MSRSRRFTHSLISGYFLMGANTIYTLVQGRMLLHYIRDNNEVGVWAVAIQVAGYFLLLDFGMSGSVGRLLMDHKDDTTSSKYGSMMKTGFVVCFAQGALILSCGVIASRWLLPEAIRITGKNFIHTAQTGELSGGQMELFWALLMWQCILTGASFGCRMFGFILETHQRYDVVNYAQSAGFCVSLLTLWWCFEQNLGLYSLVWSSVASTVCVNTWIIVSVWRMKFLPAKGRWGQVSRERFHEIFVYAMDVFLVSVGSILITASQVVVVGWALGMGAAAVWTFTTKTFAMAQQLISRIYNYSTAALAEMIVRGERERLQVRFRDLVVLTAAAGAWVTMGAALCNFSFLKVWTGGDRMAWTVENDFLMGIYIFASTTTRCHVGLVYVSKELRAMKFIYVAEGVAFLVCGTMLGRWLGLAGVIAAGIVTNLSFSGMYGLRRTAKMFRLPMREIVFNWLFRPLRFLVVMFGIAVAFRYATASLPVLWQLITNGIITVVLGGFCFWKLGLPENLQKEFSGALGKLRGRFLKQA